MGESGVQQSRGPIGEWSLKSVKSHMGSDGESFRAAIVWNGREIGTVLNDGNGGPNDYWIEKSEDRKAFDVAAEQ